MGCGRSLGVVNRVLSAQFLRLGGLIGRSPGYFLVVPVLLSLLALTGLQRINYVDDPEYLFSAADGRATLERLQTRRLFPDNYTSFSIARVVEPGQFVRLMIRSVNEGENLLTEAAFKEVVELDRMVRDVQVDAGGEQWAYDELCARFDDECLDNPAPRLLPYMADVERRDINLTFPIWLSDDFEPFLVAETLGSPQIEDGYVISAPALQMFYWAGNQTYFGVKVSLLWEEEVMRLLEASLHKFKHIQVARFGSQTLRMELNANTISIYPYTTTAFFIMVAFSVMTTMMSDWVRSKPLLGIFGVISALMGTGTACGILMYAGIEFIGINMATPFLMLGIGLDDTFVMLAAWRRTRIQDPVPKRMAETYRESAVSITITSTTNILSFLVGAISPFPSVRIFCIYTGFSVVMTYLWHVLFFGGCLAVSGYTEQRNLHSVTQLPVLPFSQSGEKSAWYRLFCSGGISASDPWNKIDNREHEFMRFFRDGLAGALNMPAVKALVLVLFAVYLSVAVWGCSIVQEGLDKRRLAREDSYSIEAFDAEEKYFRVHPWRVQVVLEGDYDYSSPDVQAKVENLLQTFENSSYVEEKYYTESWLRDFLDFVDLNKDFFPMNLSTPEAWLQSARETVLESASSQFQNDVVLDETGSRVVATRFIITTLNVNTTEDEKRVMLGLREICDRSELRCTVFNSLFAYFEQFVMVRSISIQTIGISAICMCVVSLVFIPSASCATWVAFSIASIEIGVIGYMSHWGVSLDCISMLNLIMCIGFSVDFSAHISYAFMSAYGQPASERVRISLHALGLPILQGGCSTILGVCTLFLTPSYIYITFFKTVFLVIMFGMMHGMFLLPVLLSLLGPGSHCCRKGGSVEISTAQQSSAGIPAKNMISATNFVHVNSPKEATRKNELARSANDPGELQLTIVEAGSDRRTELGHAAKALDEVSEASSQDAGLGTSGEDMSGSSVASVGEAPLTDIIACSGGSPDDFGRSGRSTPVTASVSSNQLSEIRLSAKKPSTPPAKDTGGVGAAGLVRNGRGRHSCPSLPATSQSNFYDNAAFEGESEAALVATGASERPVRLSSPNHECVHSKSPEKGD